MRLASWCRPFALAALVVLALAEPALAAGGGEKKGGLDFTGIKRYDLGIYTLVVFGLLMLIVGKFAWPKIREGLEKRETNIRSALDQAKLDRAEAETRLADAKKQLAEAAAQAKAILDEARRDADALKATKQEEAAKEAQAERDRGKRDAELKLDAMRKEYQQEVVDLAMLIASKALRQNVSTENQKQLLDESIAELKSNANRA